MLPKRLGYFPKLNMVLSKDYRERIRAILSESEVSTCLNVYSCFVDICIRDIDTQYDGTDILNSEVDLNTHLSVLIGFIYTHITASNMTLYTYCNQYKMLFRELARYSKINLREYKISDSKITNDVKKCICLYKSLNSRNSLINYYSGWICESKSGRIFTIHLAPLFDAYGAEFTGQVHKLTCDYAKKYKEETIRAKIYSIVSLFNEFTIHCKSVKDLESSLAPEKSTDFMEKIMNAIFFRSLMKNNSPKTTIKAWSETVRSFVECFIDTGFYEEPLSPFLCPIFNEPKSGKHCISLGGDLNESEKDRWLADIPLEIRDEEALNLIHRRLNLDLEHIIKVSQIFFEDIKIRLKRNIEFRKYGIVKELPKDVTRKKTNRMGIDYLANTVATFYHHGFGIGTRTTTFLGFDAQGYLLLKELCLPTVQVLNILCILLVVEHPQITPSWLTKWELFDKYGNLVGIKQVGTQWAAVSFKDRRGATLAQQEIILTKYSKDIVDTLIELTRFSREKVKEKGGNDWRYTLLVANLQSAYRSKNIGKLMTESAKCQQLLSVTSYNDNKQLILNLSDASKLAPMVTLRSIRKARAIQIYLETQSINAVSEALGHQKLRLELIEKYLPKSLMNFFYNRWVRQFQNSIIYEALKDSSYFFDALDFDEEALEVFLKNHSLVNFPEYLEHIHTASCGKESFDNMDELVFTLSIPLFQVLIAIQDIIDSAVKDDLFIPIMSKWYQSAVFILKHFSLSLEGEKYRRPPEEAIGFYESALNNPLDLVRFKEQVLCRPS